MSWTDCRPYKFHNLTKYDAKWMGDGFIFSVFKGKDEAIETGNYHGLKLTEHVLKVVEWIIEVIIQDVVNVMTSSWVLCHFDFKTISGKVQWKESQSLLCICWPRKGP